MVLTRARKRAIEGQQPAPVKKRKQSHPGINPNKPAARTSRTDPPPENTPPGSEVNESDPVAYWVRESVWPYAYIKPDPNAEKMSRILAKKKPSSRKRSEPSSMGSDTGDQNISYRSRRFVQVLRLHGSIFEMSKRYSIANESQALCETLLNHRQDLPRESLFDDDIFEITCQRVAASKEVVVVRDILPLIVPSAEIFAARMPKLECLIEGVNEAWSNCQPIISRPQPDYSVGFRREAFTEDQLSKMAPFIGDFIAGDLSVFMATSEMHFPFLACEVKCGAEALEYADRQNAHSMTLAVRGVVELFRLVKRESELHLQILAFSVSHDHEGVKIYGHYPVIDKATAKLEYCRHLILKFYFTERNGKDKWAAYQFTKNVYDLWMPEHFERICSAIDQIKPESFDLGALVETGLSSELESNQVSQSNPDLLSTRQGKTTAPIAKPIAKKQRRGR
ncbi:hypothetical protein ACQKWADRAFT_285659 [Trichoderma austrokoningii]